MLIIWIEHETCQSDVMCSWLPHFLFFPAHRDILRSQNMVNIPTNYLIHI